MSYLQLAYVHLATILPAFLIGTFLLLSRKGTGIHRLLGKAYMVLMLCTAVATLLMPARNGPRILLDHFGYGHIFSIVVLVTIFAAYRSIRRGDVRKHRQNILGSYFGAIWIAGLLAFTPGRIIHGVLFG
ncbi:MAG: DUF2306 domain-containing protein [Pseudomonadota bacterium]